MGENIDALRLSGQLFVAQTEKAELLSILEDLDDAGCLSDCYTDGLDAKGAKRLARETLGGFIRASHSQ